MPRPPSRKNNEAVKNFLVEEGYIIMGFDNVRRHAGDKIELTQGQASHFQKLGAITFDMEAVFDEPTDNRSEGGPRSALKGAGDDDVRQSPLAAATAKRDD